MSVCITTLFFFSIFIFFLFHYRFWLTLILCTGLRQLSSLLGMSFIPDNALSGFTNHFKSPFNQ